MTDTMILPTEYDGSNLTFKLLQEDGIQVLHQDRARTGAVQKNPRQRPFPPEAASVRLILSLSVKGLYRDSVAE